MIKKVETKKNDYTLVSFDNSELSELEKEFARHMWNKGWNDFMKILPNITPDNLLTEFKEFPYNREYTEGKKPLVAYYSDGLDIFR